MQLQELRVVVGPSYRRMLDHDAVHVVRRHKYKVEEGVRTARAFGKLSEVVLRCEAQNRMVINMRDIIVGYRRYICGDIKIAHNDEPHMLSHG